MEATSLWMEQKQLAYGGDGNGIGPSLIDLLDDVERTVLDRVKPNRIEFHPALGAEQVLAELSKVAFFSLSDVVVIQEDGTARLDLTEADATHMAALSEVQIEERIIKGKDGALMRFCGLSRSRHTPS
jgi:hypothetical protein